MKARRTFVTDADMDRLDNLIADLRRFPFRDQRQLEALDQVLQNAEVLPRGRVPRTLIRLNSVVRLRDLASEAVETYRLVLPEHSEISRRLLSVLTPVGMALLGHRKGQEIEAKVPGGARRFKIEDVWQHPIPRFEVVENQPKTPVDSADQSRLAA